MQARLLLQSTPAHSTQTHIEFQRKMANLYLYVAPSVSNSASLAIDALDGQNLKYRKGLSHITAAPALEHVTKLSLRFNP